MAQKHPKVYQRLSHSGIVRRLSPDCPVQACPKHGCTDRSKQSIRSAVPAIPEPRADHLPRQQYRPLRRLPVLQPRPAIRLLPGDPTESSTALRVNVPEPVEPRVQNSCCKRLRLHRQLSPTSRIHPSAACRPEICLSLFVRSGPGFILRGIATYVIPRGPRPDENVHLDLNARVTIYATERHAVDLAVMCPTECRTAHAAKLKPPTRHRFVCDQLVFTGRPGKCFRIDLGVGRARTAKRLATPRAMTASPMLQRCRNCVADRAATAPSGERHCDNF